MRLIRKKLGQLEPKEIQKDAADLKRTSSAKLLKPLSNQCKVLFKPWMGGGGGCSRRFDTEDDNGCFSFGAVCSYLDGKSHAVEKI